MQIRYWPRSYPFRPAFSVTKTSISFSLNMRDCLNVSDPDIQFSSEELGSSRPNTRPKIHGHENVCKDLLFSFFIYFRFYRNVRAQVGTIVFANFAGSGIASTAYSVSSTSIVSSITLAWMLYRKLHRSDSKYDLKSISVGCRYYNRLVIAGLNSYSVLSAICIHFCRCYCNSAAWRLLLLMQHIQWAEGGDVVFGVKASRLLPNYLTTFPGRHRSAEAGACLCMERQWNVRRPSETYGGTKERQTFWFVCRLRRTSYNLASEAMSTRPATLYTPNWACFSQVERAIETLALYVRTRYAFPSRYALRPSGYLMTCRLTIVRLLEVFVQEFPMNLVFPDSMG